MCHDIGRIVHLYVSMICSLLKVSLNVRNHVMVNNQKKTTQYAVHANIGATLRHILQYWKRIVPECP